MNLYFLASKIWAQPGCPNVYDGADVNLECASSSTSLVADPFKTGVSCTCIVSSIPYNPPVAFNQVTPAFNGIDDVWSEVIPLPFNFFLGEYL